MVVLWSTIYILQIILYYFICCIKDLYNFPNSSLSPFGLFFCHGFYFYSIKNTQNIGTRCISFISYPVFFISLVKPCICLVTNSFCLKKLNIIPRTDVLAINSLVYIRKYKLLHFFLTLLR